MFKMTNAIITLVGVGICSTLAYSQEPSIVSDDIQLSQDLRTLLQTEMREIAAASQAIVMSFVIGDWQSVHRISEQIRASYILEKSISDSQKQELQDNLPDRFKWLDAEFHARAERLGLAAAAEDPEIIAFHYGRMLETCATCHAAFARARFPGFSPEVPQVHQH